MHSNDPQKNSIPLVSVLVVTYRHAPYLRQCLDGILCQKVNFTYEIVVSDDASGDGTEEILQDYSLRYPGLFNITIHKTNKGLLDNYFDALFSCQGRYIADCAGDDYWTDPTKLQQQVALLESQPRTMFVHTNYREWNAQSHSFTPHARNRHGFSAKPLLTSNEAIRELVCSRYFFAFPSSSCFRKEEFKRFYDQHTDLFRNKTYPCEDFQILFACAWQGDIAFIDQEMAVYRVFPVSQGHQTVLSQRFAYTINTLKLRLDMANRFALKKELYDDLQKIIVRDLYILSIQDPDHSLYEQTQQLVEAYHLSLSPFSMLLKTLLSRATTKAMLQTLYRLQRKIRHL